MKKLLIAAIALLGFGAASAHAADLKIAIYDMPSVVNATNAAKRGVVTLRAKHDAAQAKIDGMEKQLVEKQNKLSEQKAVMSPDKFAAAQQDFAKDVEKFRSDGQAIQTDLEKDQDALSHQIIDAVRASVEALAKEKGYDLILFKGAVSFSSAHIPNISDEIVARANKLLDK